MIEAGYEPKKRIVIRLKDSAERVYRWRIWHIPRAVLIIGGQHPSRVIRGWQYEDHDGYARFAEGNWQDLVRHFKSTAENYGLELLQELS
jgi:hypothetical protein